MYIDADDTTDVPPGLVTTTPAFPVVDRAGTTKVTDVGVVERMEAAAPPTETAVTGPIPVPLATTDVPPVTGPLAGLSDVTVGTGS